MYVNFFFCFSTAIELNKKYSKAFMKRARAYELLDRKEDCLRGDLQYITFSTSCSAKILFHPYLIVA